MLLIKNMVLPNEAVVDFTLEDGSFMVIHGPNGAGKSLLLRSVALLERTRFQEFTFEGKPATQWSPQSYRSRVLYVPSSAHNLDLTVEEYLKAPLRLAVNKDLGSMDDALELAKSLSLSGKTLNLLSMGQRQILSLIRAVNLKARVLLLDEPTSHLDPKMVSFALDLVQDWKARTGGSAVMVGHHEDEARALGIVATQFTSFLRLPTSADS